MGNELHLQSIPETCILLELARSDYEAIAWLWRFDRILTSGSYYLIGDDAEKHKKLNELALKCIKANPDIKERNFRLGQRFDQILYLLSPRRRDFESIDTDTSLFNIAIQGEVKLNPKDDTHFVSPDTVNLIAHFLQSVTLDEMRKYFDVEDMIEAGVYKFFENTWLEVIWSEFLEIRDVYVSASKHNEAMLTKID